MISLITVTLMDNYQLFSLYNVQCCTTCTFIFVHIPDCFLRLDSSSEHVGENIQTFKAHDICCEDNFRMITFTLLLACLKVLPHHSLLPCEYYHLRHSLIRWPKNSISLFCLTYPGSSAKRRYLWCLFGIAILSVSFSLIFFVVRCLPF